MQKWEYKLIARIRGAEPRKNEHILGASAWDIDMEKMLPQLGDEGWELVAISDRSGLAGGSHELSSYGMSSGKMGMTVDLAGFTDNEVWVFKRPKP